MTRTLLVVEDDGAIRKTLKDALETEGYAVRAAGTAEDGLAELRRAEVHLALLDVRLPGMSGFDLCRKLREAPEWKRMPVLFLTSKADLSNKVLGLEIGGNDYITKPFSVLELLARVKAALRTAYPDEGEDRVLRGNGVVVDLARGTVRANDKPVKLPRKELDLLSLLLRKKEMVLSRAVLMESVWGQSLVETSRTVDTHVYRLRRHLGDAGKNIRAVGTMGYKWTDEA